LKTKQTNIVNKLYLDWAAALAENPEMTLEEWRDIESRHGWVVLTTEPGGVDYLETRIGADAGGVPALWVVPKGSAEDRVVLCLHGGGFVTGSMYTHRKLFGHLAKAVGARALVPNYRLAPEHVHPAQLEDAVAAYRWLLDQGIKANHIALAGDSAGGGLVLSTLLRVREQGLSLPAAALPFSPWVDMELGGGTILSNEGKDLLFQTKAMVEGLVSLFLGKGGNRRDPHASPLYANLSGLPPVYIQVGDQELLLDDSRRLANYAKKAGVDVRLDVFPGQQHTFQANAGRIPEADEAIRRLADWVRPKLGLADTAQ
jgi:monoterpene epsilon-lactone hydrolase